LINWKEDRNGRATSPLNRFVLDRGFNGRISRNLHGDPVMRCGGSLSQLRTIGAPA
jgi:hypothetical protein